MAASPGGVEIGRVSIRVLPDSSRFATDLQADLARVERELKVSIPTELDTSGLDRDLAAVTAQVRAAGQNTVTIGVRAQADLASARAAVAGVQAAAKGSEIKVPVSFDDRQFTDRIHKQLDSIVKEVDPKIPLTIDGEALRVKYAAAVESLRDTLAIKVPMELSDKLAFKKDVLVQLAEIEALTKKFHPTITVNTKVDHDLATRTLEALGAKLGGALSGVLDLRLGALQDVATQITLILSRAAGYTVVLGPTIAVALAGALALAPAFAVALPIVGALAAGVAVIALGFNTIFGAKQTGGGKSNRAGGIFDSIIAQVGTLRVEIGQLLTVGLDPLIERFSSAAFPIFAAGLKQMAVVINTVAREFLTFASSTDSLSNSKVIFSGLAQSAGTLGQAVTPIARALQQITVASLPGFQALAEALLRVSVSFSVFIDDARKSGALEQVITQSVNDVIGFVTGISSLIGDMGGLLITLEPVARGVFGAIGSALSTIFTGLDDAISKFRLAGSPGLQAMIGLFTQLLVTVHGLVPALLDTFRPITENATVVVIVQNVADALSNTLRIAVELGGALLGVTHELLVAFGPTTLSALATLTGAIADITQFLADNKALVVALGAAYVTSLIPALVRMVIASDAFILISVRVLEIGTAFKVAAVASLAFSRSLLTVAASAVTAMVTAVGDVILSLAGIPAAVIPAIASTESLGGALVGLGVAAKGLAATILSPFNLIIAGVASAVFIYQRGMDNIEKATQRGRDTIDNMAKGVDLLDPVSIQEKLDAIAGAQQKALATGTAVAKTYDGVFGTIRLGFNNFTGADTRLSNLTGQATEAQKKLNELATAAVNVDENIKGVADQTGATDLALRNLARANGIDLSKPFADSGAARQQMITDLKTIQLETGLSAAALPKALGADAAAWAKYAKVIQDAQDAASKAFQQQTDVITNFDTSKNITATAKATDAVTVAQNRLNDTEARLAAKRKITAGDLITQARSQANLATAQGKLDQAQAAEASNTLANYYRNTIKLGTTFTSDISAAIARGLDPAFVTKLLAAGPKQAVPLLQGILADHSGRMIKMVNDSEAQLARLNSIVVEQTRLTNLAVKSGDDQMTRDLTDAMKIAQQVAADGGAATTAAIVQQLHLPNDEVRRIAREFGINVVDQVDAAVKAKQITVTIGGKLVILATDFNFSDSIVPAPAGGGRAKRAYGGLVTGPGGPRDDRIHTMLSNKEFVHQATAVEHYGVNVMTAINQMRIPRSVLQTLASPASWKQVMAGAHATVVQPVVVPMPMPAQVGSVARPRDVLGEQQAHADGPLTLLLLDADGGIVSRMRATVADERVSAANAKRLARLGGRGR